MGKFFDKISKFFAEYLFNTKWRCIACGEEIFNEQYFCDKCKNTLPVNDGKICQHCGRQLKVSSEYCTTCKGRLTNVDKARSIYSYKKPVNVLIKNLKYDNACYVVEAVVSDLANLYFKSYFNADMVTFVPMTERAKRKRGYNQSELLAQEFSKKTGIELAELFVKVKETKRQATLNRENRQKNLLEAFKVCNRSKIKDKKVLIIDDVTTTGATAEVLAGRLKKAKASAVYLLTVASVPPKDGY